MIIDTNVLRETILNEISKIDGETKNPKDWKTFQKYNSLKDKYTSQLKVLDFVDEIARQHNMYE